MLSGKEKITLYHATPAVNVESIKKKGVIKRTEQYCHDMIDRVLAQCNLERETCPTWRWELSLRRCLESTRDVFLTTQKPYAIQNCRAGLEAELSVLERALAYKRHKAQVVAPQAKPEWIRVNPCAVCSFELTLDELLNMRYENKIKHQPYVAERLPHEKFIQDEKDRLSHRIELHKRWGDPYPYASLEGIIGTVILDHMPPEKLVSCELVKPEDDPQLAWAEKLLTREISNAKTSS